MAYEVIRLCFDGCSYAENFNHFCLNKRIKFQRVEFFADGGVDYDKKVLLGLMESNLCCWELSTFGGDPMMNRAKEYEDAFVLEKCSKAKLRQMTEFALNGPEPYPELSVIVGRDPRGEWKVTEIVCPKPLWDRDCFNGFLSACEVRVYPTKTCRNRKVPKMLDANYDQDATVLILARNTPRQDLIGDILDQWDIDER